MGEYSSVETYGYVGAFWKKALSKNVMVGYKCSVFAENHVFLDKKFNKKKLA